MSYQIYSIFSVPLDSFYYGLDGQYYYLLFMRDRMPMGYYEHIALPGKFPGSSRKGRLENLQYTYCVQSIRYNPSPTVHKV